MAVAVQQGAPNPMLVLAGEILQSRQEIDELEERLKELKKLNEQQESQLIEMMLAEEVDKFVFAGRTFYPSTRLWASLKAESKDEAIEWLEQSDYADLVKKQVNSQSLSSLVKELRENDEMPEEFEQYLNISERVTLTIRKGAKG
jgi:hypothetical protein